MEDRKRDLALFNLAIDSKLRGCDAVALRVDDVAPSGDGPSNHRAEGDGPAKSMKILDAPNAGM